MSSKTDPTIHDIDRPVNLSAPPTTPADEALAVGATPMEPEGLTRVDLPKGAPGAARVTVVLRGGMPALVAPEEAFRTVADARKIAQLDTSEAVARIEGFIAAVESTDALLGAHVRAAIMTAHTSARRLTATKIVDPDTGRILSAELKERVEKAEVAAVKRAEKLGKSAPDLVRVAEAAEARLLRGAQAAERSAFYWSMAQGLASAAELLQDCIATGKLARSRARAERRPLTPEERAMVSQAEAAKLAMASIPPS